METLSVLPAPCQRNPLATSGFLKQRAGNAEYDVFFDVNLNK